MFEILFKYPWTVFEKGRIVLLSGAPLWLLAALLAASGAAL